MCTNHTGSSACPSARRNASPVSAWLRTFPPSREQDQKFRWEQKLMICMWLVCHSTPAPTTRVFALKAGEQRAAVFPFHSGKESRCWKPAVGVGGKHRDTYTHLSPGSQSGSEPAGWKHTWKSERAINTFCCCYVLSHCNDPPCLGAGSWSEEQ